MVQAPASLVADVAPYLGELALRVESDPDNLGRTSVKAALSLVQYLATVLIQDSAASLAAEYPDHDVMRFLQGFPEFRCARACPPCPCQLGPTSSMLCHFRLLQLH